MRFNFVEIKMQGLGQEKEFLRNCDDIISVELHCGYQSFDVFYVSTNIISSEAGLFQLVCDLDVSCRVFSTVCLFGER